MSTVAATGLDCLYEHERQTPGLRSLSQAMSEHTVQDFTWAQVADGARRMAAHLQQQAWPAGSKIAILSKNCAWWLMSDLAIWMAGHVSVPLYPTLSAETIAQILAHSEARACFVGKLDGWAAMKPGIPAGMPCISYPLSPEDAKAGYPGWDAICAAQAPLAGNPVRAANELCTLVYTSGTTGEPKGVMHSFGGFAWVARAMLALSPADAGDRALSHLPLAHVAERVVVEHAWLFAGVQVFFAHSLESFAADMQRARPTIFFTVPRLWLKFQQAVHAKLPPARLKALLRLPVVGGLLRRKILRTLGLDQCRIAASGAAPMPASLLAWYADLGLPVSEGLGMSENGVSHVTTPGELGQQGTVGRSLPGIDVRIDAGTGELQLRSPGMMLGYYKAPELTRQTFTEDGWLRTGDQVALDARGNLRVTGRLKELFKTSKGKYVTPAPIEGKLGAHPAVEACVVAGAGAAQPLALAMLSAEAAAQPAEGLATQLGAHLEAVNATLAPHERLSCLVLTRTPWSVDNGLITPTFKVKRQRIEQLFGEHFEAWAGQGRQVLWAD